jgi:predicted alpha/beta hydrolase family esterase
MRNAIILHGGPSKKEYYDPNAPSMSNAHWLPWLQGQLLKVDIAATTPEVPHSFDRNWKVWSYEVERFDITSETILVGHSTGAGFFIKYLSIHPDIKVGKVVLVAPWLDPYHNKTKNFFDDFEIDTDLVSRTKGVTIFYSDNDQESVQKTVSIIRAKIKGLKFKEFYNYGHFCYNDMKTNKFPELLEEIIEQS